MRTLKHSYQSVLLVSIMIIAGLYSGTTLAEPPPGHPSVEQAQKTLQVPDSHQFPHRGQVLQAIDSNDYTYIEVITESRGKLWLAAPQQSLTINSWIRYPDGMLMKNFYSKNTSAPLWR